MIKKVISYKLWVISLVVFLTSLYAGCYAQPTENIVNKTKENNPYSWDFGQIKEREILKHNFVFKNDSSKTVTIKDITTSCGCTVSQVKKKTILPDEDTLIQVQFNTKGYFGQTQQFVYVHTDDLDNPIIRYIIKADVIKE